MINRERFHSSLLILQSVALATLVRSIAFDRWATVVAAAMLFVGALAAKRDRAWGVALALAGSLWFPAVWLLGMAPGWFAFVGAAGMMPFLLASKAFAKFDKGATAFLASIAGVVGIGGGLAWKAWAIPLFREFPSLRPGVMPAHGATLAAVVAAAAVAMHLTRKTKEKEITTQYRVAEPVHARIATDVEEEWESNEEESKTATRKSL